MSRAAFRYEHAIWGEIIHATKAQLQSFGIGVDAAFPGEPEQPSSRLKVIDPRGYQTSIYHSEGDVFSAHISFTERRCLMKKFESPDLGGALRARPAYISCDRYIGTADALVGAGLVRFDQLPGQPGVGKCQVTILADSTGSRKSLAMFDPGTKVIQKVSKSTYGISITVSPDEQERRWAAEQAHRDQHWAYWNDQPRPAPLHAVYAEMMRLAMLPPNSPRSESAAAFTDSLAGMAELFVSTIKNNCKDAAYRLSEAAQVEVERAGERFLDSLRSAEIVPVQSATVTQLHNGFWLRAGEPA